MSGTVQETEHMLKQLFEARLEQVFDTATRHFDQTFVEVKIAGKVQGQTNEIWWLTQGLPVADQDTMLSKMAADIESRLGKATRPHGHGSHGKKVRIRVPERKNI